MTSASTSDIQRRGVQRRVQQRVRRLLGRATVSVQVREHLSGGYTNDNYLVEVDGERYVVRLGSAVAELLGVDRQREQRVLVAAADAGLIPAVVAFDADSGDLLARFVDAASAADRTGAATVDVAALAALLRRAHALDVETAAADPRDWVGRYVTAAARTGFVWPAVVQRALPHLAEIAYTASTLTHHDVNPWNILHAPDGDLLLDWEYAGRGDPAFDLAGVATLWELSGTAHAELLDRYGADDSLRTRMADALWLFQMRELTWAGLMLAAGIDRVEIAEQYAQQCAWLAEWSAGQR